MFTIYVYYYICLLLHNIFIIVDNTILQFAKRVEFNVLTQKV